MPDTPDNGSAELAAKQKELDDTKAALEKEKGRVVGAEKKFSEWATELGEIRKDRDTLKETLKEAQKALEALKSAPPVETEHKQEDKGKEESDTLEKGLTEEQRKIGEERFNAMSPAEKLKYDSDGSFRLAFLKRLSDSTPVIPSTPWKTAKKADKKEVSEYETILDRVFNKKKSASFVPPGSTGGISSMGSGDVKPYEPPEDNRVR